MSTKSTFRPRFILGMLLLAIISAGFSLIALTRIDAIVHSELYDYGLRFSNEWAEPYWMYTKTALGSVIFFMILVGVSMAFVVLYTRTGNTTLKTLSCPLLITCAAALILSAYMFSQQDYTIHQVLYRYGLQFSSEWATGYWTYAWQTIVTVGIAALMTLSSLALVYLTAQDTKRIDTAKLAHFLLLTIGALALALSVVYTSTVLAFIGLGLILWGILLTYVHTEDRIRGSLLDSTAFPPLATLNQIIQEMKYDGKAVYLPPKYFKDPETTRVYIPRQGNTRLPTPEQTQAQETRIFVEDPEGLLLTPPGEELSRLFERTLKTTFTRMNVQYMQRRLPKLFVEDLEISREFQINVDENRISVKIEGSPYKKLFQKTEELGDTAALGSPLVSALACTIAKASGRPVTIESQKVSENGDRIEIEYSMPEKESTE